MKILAVKFTSDACAHNPVVRLDYVKATEGKPITADLLGVIVSVPGHDALLVPWVHVSSCDVERPEPQNMASPAFVEMSGKRGKR